MQHGESQCNFCLDGFISLAIATPIWHKLEMKNKFWFEYEIWPEKEQKGNTCIKTMGILLFCSRSALMYDCFRE